MRGPVPKRSSQRRRVNKPEGPPPSSGAGSGRDSWMAYARSIGMDVPDGATRAEVQELVAAGSSDSDWTPLVAEWFSSLRESGQSAFYEPSDWATARVLAEVLSKALKADKVSAALIERWQAGATELLTTEGARRRARIELEREPEAVDEGTPADVSEFDEYRRRRDAAG